MSINKQKSVSDTLWDVLFFIIWPFLALIYSSGNLSNRFFKNSFILFFGLFGLTFVYNEASDSYRHAQSFTNMSELPFSEFFRVLTGLYSADGQKPDFFEHLVSFVVSRFTSDTRIYFMILSLFLGWMLIKNIKVLNDVYIKNKTVTGLIFLVFLIVLVPPVRLLSFRHYLALLVFVYGCYNYFRERKLKYLLILGSSVFIHFGFLMIVALFFLFFLLGRRNLIYYALIVLSFLYHDQATNYLRQFGLGFELSFNQIISGYTNEKYLEKISELQSQRYLLLNSYIRWSVLFMIIASIYHKIKYMKFDEVSEKLYSFGLILFAFVNFSQDIESIANRFGVLFQILSCIFFINLYTNNNIKNSNFIFKFATLLFLAVNFVILSRTTMEYANILTVLPLLPLMLFSSSDYSILDLIK